MAEKHRISYLDIARSIAIISITFNHAVNRSFNTSENQLAEFLSIPVWMTIIKTVLYVFSRIGVPFFVMISGSLLISHNYDHWGGYADLLSIIGYNCLLQLRYG